MRIAGETCVDAPSGQPGAALQLDVELPERDAEICLHQVVFA